MFCTRRSFTTEYKVEAAHRVINSGRTIAEVVRELGLNDGLLGKWVADERRRMDAAAAHGDIDDFRAEFRAAGLPWVMALRPRRGMWVYGPAAYTPVDAASELAWHALPGPGSAREADSPYPPADLAEITRLYGLRHWVEQSYIQVEDELGWADFQVRSDLAIRRHQILVCCAFSFCWAHWLTHPPPERAPSPLTGPTPERGGPPPDTPRKLYWPRVIRAVRAWLTPSLTLRRYWAAWSHAPPPAELQQLIDTVGAGHGLHLYLPTRPNELPVVSS